RPPAAPLCPYPTLFRSDPALAASLTELANLHVYDGRPEAARPLYDEALAALRAAPDSAVRSDVATALNGLAAVHMANAAYDTARSEEHTSELQSRENLV